MRLAEGYIEVLSSTIPSCDVNHHAIQLEKTAPPNHQQYGNKISLYKRIAKSLRLYSQSKKKQNTKNKTPFPGLKKTS